MNIDQKKACVILLLVCSSFCCTALFAQNPANWQQVGTIKPKNSNEIKTSNWLIGCETLDRDYADYDAYKTYLVPLGIKRIRLQGGWAKTEKEKGVYDFKWLDHIIDDAVSRGLQPWLELSYGNAIYNGGGGINLSSGIPSSDEGLSAWDNWVKAMVTHYKTRVKDWEIWNEPNNIKDNRADLFANFTIRTLDIIKAIQPDARISVLAMSRIDVKYADDCLKIINDKGKIGLIDNITYHGYCKNPDEHYTRVEKLKSAVAQYRPVLKLRQGENGAPSLGKMGGALSDYDWTELSQAKWDTRRMLGDLGRDIESSVFTIVDIAYNSDGPIKKLNVKGLLASDSNKRVIKQKMAYFAVQHVTSIFTGQLERIRDFNYTSTAISPISVFAYRDKTTKKQVITIWQNSQIPANDNQYEAVDFNIANCNFINPVYVDVVSGKVYQIPANQWHKKGNSYTFSKIPVFDGPVLIADKSLVSIRK